MSATAKEAALQLTERNLSSLIAARHPDAVLMSDWREVVRRALSIPEALSGDAAVSKTAEQGSIPCGGATSLEEHGA